MFRPQLKDRTEKDLVKIASRSSSTQWYSPGPTLACQPIADVKIASLCAETDGRHTLGRAWLSAFLDGATVALRHRSWQAGRWALSLGQYGSLLAIGWPLVLRSWQGDLGWKGIYFEISQTVRTAEDLVWLLVVDESEWEAHEVTFRSPLHQALVRRSFDFDRGRASALRLEPTGPAQPLLSVIARQAFNMVGKALLVKLARHLGLATMSPASLFEVLWDLVKHATQEDDAACLEILAARLSSKQMNIGELLEIGDAAEGLDPGDQRDLKRQSKLTAAEEAERNEFKRHYDGNRAAVGSRRGGSASSAGARRQPTPLSGIKKRKMPRLGELTQASVQALVPPGAHAWKSATGSWQIHLPPWPRKSRAWAINGEQEAARFVLRYAWQLWLESNNLEESRCPIAGLFD